MPVMREALLLENHFARLNFISFQTRAGSESSLDQNQ